MKLGSDDSVEDGGNKIYPLGLILIIKIFKEGLYIEYLNIRFGTYLLKKFESKMVGVLVKITRRRTKRARGKVISGRFLRITA